MWTAISLLITVVFCSRASPLQDLIEVTVAEDSSLAKQYGTHEGAIIGDIEIVQHRNSISNPHMKWPGGKVPYIVSSLYSTGVHSTISAAMREIEQNVNPPGGYCVQFIPRTTEANYIEIYPGIGCHTVIGMLDRGKQGLSLGRGCESKGVIMHELLHVLGFWHEQSRNDRSNFVNINFTNVDDSQQTDFIAAPASMINTLNTSYDFGSIMHYGPYTHAKDVTVPVITPKNDVDSGVQMGQRLALSETDVRRVQRWYDCVEDVTHINKPDQIVRCDFANDVCYFTHDETSSFRWAILSGRSGSGPNAGNTNGADRYLVARESGQNVVAGITTPVFNASRFCIDFFRFQQGPSSYLRLVATGPKIRRTTIVSNQGNNTLSWTHVTVGINIPAETSLQITFEAVMDSGDVAIDDLYLYKGACL